MDAMQFWLNNFLWSILVMLFIGWFIPKLFWFPKVGIIARILVSTIFSFLAMALTTTIWAMFMLMIGSFGAVISTFVGNPIGGLLLYFELGAELTVGWILSMVIKIITLTVRDIKQSNSDGKNTPVDQD